MLYFSAKNYISNSWRGEKNCAGSHAILSKPGDFPASFLKWGLTEF